MAKQDLYALLRVERSATSAELDVAYQTACATLLARPDAHGDDVQNRLKFLRFAHETLLHKGRRDAYDASLIEAPVPAPAAARTSRTRPAPARSGAARLPRPMLMAGVGAFALIAAAVWFTKSSKASQAAPVAAPAIASLVADAKAADEGAGDAPPSSMSAEALFERYSKSVVLIIGFDGNGRPVLQGSGVVVADQRVITNCHVAKAATQIGIELADKRYEATLLRADPDPLHDLCLLAVADLHAPAIGLGNMATVKIGQKVFALGAPRGLDLTLSEGIVSSLRKYEDSHFIQTTASISPGSSGGALFNEAGALVGITTFNFTNGQNLNFAVPVDWVAKLLGNVVPLANLSTDAMGDLLGAWHCESDQMKSPIAFHFKSDGTFQYTRPKSPDSAFTGTYGITGNHTLTLTSEHTSPPDMAIEIMALSRTNMRISAPFRNEAMAFDCRKSAM
jgi:serine protease Do